MVSTRTKGSPVVMLDDHDKPIQQPAAKPGDKPSRKRSRKATAEVSANSKSKTQSKKSVQGPSNDQPENKATTTKSTRSTRSNPNPSELAFPEPEQILQKRNSRKTRKASQPPKTTASVKYKGKKELEATVEGDDKRDEGDLLGGGEVRVDIQMEDADYDPEEEEEEEVQAEAEEISGERFKKSGKPFKGQRERPGLGTKQNGVKKQQQKKKQRQVIGKYHDHYDDDSEKDEKVLREMSLDEYLQKLQTRMSTMEQELTIIYYNTEKDRRSIERRIMAADYIMMDTVKGFNDIGIYNGVSMGSDDPNGQTIVPKILRGDPFPEDATNFDENHPAIQALFPDEQMAYEADIFESQLNNVDGAIEAANELHRISEMIWFQSVRYRSLLQRQKHFLETCKGHANDIKNKYIVRRRGESDRQARAAEARARPKELVFALPERPSRKRRLDPPAIIVSKRQRSTLEQGRRYQSSASESASVGGPSTPPPADRVVVDHTPGRTRRIHQPQGAASDRTSGRSSGIHDDNAPWTSEENKALDATPTEKKGWRLIKPSFGMFHIPPVIRKVLPTLPRLLPGFMAAPPGAPSSDGEKD
ncbi:uncharacterized protein DFL_002807 [Arthrobotrys flagrans]|uniref:Uncharacterized protein n=1 Tax=Arthrobotrys flagrans TaxID=97331 RepID=A0A437ABJ1_ARTFL|nr:hypothetical protein DFL_002807 [Arthrobotrys flagrans]